MKNAFSEDHPATAEALRQQLNAACNQMADAQSSLQAACDEFDAADASATHMPDQMLRLESACRNAGMATMRLTTGYLTALTAYSRALQEGRADQSQP